MINNLDKSASSDNYNKFHAIFIPKKLAEEQCEFCYRIFCCVKHKGIHETNKHEEQLAVRNKKMENQKKNLLAYGRPKQMRPKISTPLSMKKNFNPIDLKQDEMIELKKGLADKSFKVLLKNYNKNEQDCLTIENSNNAIYDKENYTDDSLKLSIKYTKINGNINKTENNMLSTKNLIENNLLSSKENYFEIKLNTSKDLSNDITFNTDKTLQQTLYSCIEYNEMEVTYNKMAEQDTFYSVIDDSIEVYPKDKAEKNNIFFRAIKKIVNSILIYFPNRLTGLNEENNSSVVDNKGGKRRYFEKTKDNEEENNQDQINSPNYKKFCPSKNETNLY